MIFKEAINNLAKYSNADHASVRLYKINKIFFLEVKDNGIGFNMQSVTGGNGLRNMKERAKNLNGRLTVLSGNGGTKIILEFTT
jgi:signal transduction histidine kinase